jgi:hypothetical protein
LTFGEGHIAANNSFMQKLNDRMVKTKKDNFRLVGLKLENKTTNENINQVRTAEIYGKNLKQKKFLSSSPTS